MAAISIMAVVVLACSTTREPNAPLALHATVRYVPLEGGFYALRGDDGVTYDPDNLPPAFAKEGLRVRVRLRLRPDMGGIHMAGPIVDVLEISAL
ncbi:MAG: hypothetical protein NVS4B3_02890 [Gemmatimonadaceae bacterium]